MFIEFRPFAEAAEFADGSQHGKVRSGQQLDGGFEFGNPDILVGKRCRGIGAGPLGNTSAPASVVGLPLLIFSKQPAA